MAACNFSIPFGGNPEQVIAKARSTIQSKGSNFEGDTNSGNFSVSVFGNAISGSYTVAGQDLNIVIDSKPFLVPCSAIEGFLKNKISG